MTTLKRSLAQAARWAVVAATAPLTTLAIGLLIASARGEFAGRIPVPLHPLAYLAMLMLAPVFASFAVSGWLATRLGLMNYSSGSMTLLQIIVILTSLPVLSWVVRFASSLPA